MSIWKQAAGASLVLTVCVGAATGAAAFGSDAGIERNVIRSTGQYAARTDRGTTGFMPLASRGAARQHGVLPMTRTPGATRAAPQQHGVVRQASVRPQLQIDPQFLPATVPYPTRQSPGTIVIDTEDKYLYLVQSGGMAKRYGVGVGRPGFQWSGTHRVSMKREWPGWTPPAAMRRRQPELPAYMPGGPENPLGARAMYLGNTLYRIHGSNAPWTIGHEVSSGCIRMRNEDVIDLYEKVKVGTKVVVLR